MSRTTINFWLDLLSLFVMLGLAITGGITHYVLPAGTGQSHALFGLGRHDYGQIHFYLAFTAVLLLALHVALHWSWICCVIAKAMGHGQPSRKSQVLAGAAVLACCGLLLGGGIWWASTLVTQRPNTGRHEGRGLGSEVSTAPGMPESAMAAPAPDSSETDDARPDSNRGTLEKHEEECARGLTVNGRTTLQEAATAAGLTVEAMLKELRVSGIGSGASQEPLGRLKRQFGFSIHDVRRLVCRPQ